MENDAKIEALQEVTGNLKHSDYTFANSLIAHYRTKTWLSDKQWYWVNELTVRGSGSVVHTKNPTNEIEEIFNGKAIQALMRAASVQLKRPKLRYPTDKWGKIIFSYVADSTSKWFGTTFIDNGGKEHKTKYGFINSNGEGNLRRQSAPEIKTAILKIAKDPVNEARLSGQKFRNCCFCGLELINKSSVYYGYGPICAGKYGLPWGGTEEDAKEAGEAELAQLNLVDLGNTYHDYENKS
jgi:hypothetical protein